jgi:hypothetical protein
MAYTRVLLIHTQIRYIILLLVEILPETLYIVVHHMIAQFRSHDVIFQERDIVGFSNLHFKILSNNEHALLNHWKYTNQVLRNEYHKFTMSEG